MTIERMQDSSLLPDIRMSNIEGFSQEITMEMNQLSWQQGWNQHLRQDAVWPQIKALHQADINTFMGTWSQDRDVQVPLTPGMVGERPSVP